jgi:hypothetical protein
MKSETVSNANVTFYDILTKGVSQSAMYAGNENIVEILISDDYKIKFPIYAHIINNSSERGKEGKSCWNHVIKFSIFSLTTSPGYHMTVLKKYSVT